VQRGGLQSVTARPDRSRYRFIAAEYRARRRIGSTYEELLATYGGKPRNRTGRFVIICAATVPGTSVSHPNKRVDKPESMTFVVENGRVAAMTVSVDLGGEF